MYDQKLPTDTPELEVIIEKAGDYLLSEKDFGRAADLYAAASAILPASTAILGGLGYCLSKLKRLDESIAVQRRALAFEPNNYNLLNDLGWALTESGQFDEAEALLQKALARKFHTQIEQRSGGSVRRLENIRPNDDDTHRFFFDRL